MVKRLSIKPFLILLVLGFSCRNFGPISFRLEGLLILTCLVVYIFACNPLRRLSVNNGNSNLDPATVLTVKGILPYPVLIVFAVFISQVSGNLFQLFALSAFLVSLLFFSRWRRESTDVHIVSILTTILFTFVIFFYQYFTEYWYIVELYAWLFSKVCGFIYARVLNLGPTSFGFFIFISFVIYHGIIFGLSKNRSLIRLSLALLYLFIATVIVVGINLVSIHFIKKVTFSVGRNDIHSQILLFLISCPSILFYKDIELFKILILPAAKIYKYAIPCIGAFLILVVIFFIPYFHAEPIEGKTVAFYKKGSLDWNIPKFGTYGQRSGGMFGLMPQYLKTVGVNIKMLDRITVPDLANSDVLVMINLDDSLSKKDIVVIWDYVRSGGGLLILGDHTNLAGLMVNSNKILEVVNIKFKFDSAMPTRYTWDFLLDERSHHISGHFAMEIARSWWVGASVECKPPAEPVVLGKYCYSDWGYKNNKKNAYLGNRKFDYYEPLNDQVLAAYSRYGKGKIMVCGDTSSFHNTTFMITHPFVFNTFKFLADSRQEWGQTISYVLIVSLSLLTIFSAVFTFKRDSGLILPLSFLFVTSLAVLVSTYGGDYKKETIPHENLKVAYIDYSHKGRFDLMSWEDDSIGGLRNNLLRNGFFPLLLRKFKAEKIFQSKLIIIIAPTEPFSTKEVDILNKFAENGGHVIITVGWEEVGASLTLLENFGFGIDNVPLGWCQSDYKKTKIQFHEAWPVITKDVKNVKVICSPLDYPAIVSKKYGKGFITLIADSYFLLNVNLEGSKKFSVPNIFLLSDLLNQK
ncbi:MAG: hypothetical protein ACUZ8H_10675 [Candidatus Anammoxibacter sp.]